MAQSLEAELEAGGIAAGDGRASCRALLTAGIAALLTLACAAPATHDPAGPAANPAFPPPPDRARFQYETTLRFGSQIHLETPAEKLRRVATGGLLPEYPLVKPLDVAALEGRLYITDTVANRVHVLDAGRRRYFQIGGRRDGNLKRPTGINVGLDGTVYVVDSGQSLVKTYDPLGLPVSNFGAGVLQHPVAAAPDAAGENLYVVDNGGVDSDRHVIAVFSREGRHIRDLGRRGESPGTFNLPVDIEIGPSGQLYVLDAGNFRVQVLMPDGTFVREFGKAGRDFGTFARPRHLAIDEFENVYVSDAFFGNVQLFDRTGRLLLSIGSNGPHDAPARYGLLAGIDVDRTGRVYLVDQFFRKIDVFRRVAPVGTR